MVVAAKRANVDSTTEARRNQDVKFFRASVVKYLLNPFWLLCKFLCERDRMFPSWKFMRRVLLCS